MRTNNHKNVDRICKNLAVLGLIGNDAYKLAKRINEGTKGKTVAKYCEILEKACQNTIQSGGNVFIRSAGGDVVLYGPNGYIVVDHTAGWLDYAYTYKGGRNFYTHTRAFQPTSELPIAC
jgi:hypothetical protein